MMYEQQQQQVQMNMNMMRSKRQVDLDKKRRNNNSEEEDNKLQIVDLSGISLDSLPNPPLNLATICKLDLSNNNLQMFEAWKKDYGSRLRKKKNGWGRHG